MSSLTPHQLQEWRILSELESGGTVSQRTLARRLGIALGLTNQLVRGLVERRLIRCAPGGRKGAVLYRLTRIGRAHRDTIFRERMHALAQAFGEAKRRVEERLMALDGSWDAPASEKRIVFYDDGSGMSELGALCLRSTSLRLVGVVGVNTATAGNHSCEQLSGLELAGQSFERLVVMTFAPAQPIRVVLRTRGVPQSATFWI